MNKLAITALLATALFGAQAPAQAETDTSWTIILSGGDYRARHYEPRRDHYYSRDHRCWPGHVHQHRAYSHHDAWHHRDHGRKYGRDKHGKFGDHRYGRLDDHHDRYDGRRYDDRRGQVAGWMAHNNR